jgi:hypothetical protein
MSPISGAVYVPHSPILVSVPPSTAFPKVPDRISSITYKTVIDPTPPTIKDRYQMPLRAANGFLHL